MATIAETAAEEGRRPDLLSGTPRAHPLDRWIYVFTAAGLRATSLGDAFREALASPWGIALQVAMLIGLVLFAKIDWAKWLGDRNRAG